MPVSGDELLYLPSADIARACAEIDALSCVTKVLLEHAAGTARVGVEGVIRWSPAPGQAARTLNMPGLLETRDVVGTKIINANTGNPDRGLPRADGLLVLLDPQTARPAVILQAAQISALRTAAVSTIAALRLHNGEPLTLAVIGAGKIAEEHVRLMVRHLKVDRVIICDRLPERAEALAARLRTPDDLASPVGTGTVEEAVRDANVVVTATTATSGYIPGSWLRPGALAINVSLDDFTEDAYLGTDLLYVDDWELITDDTQRLLGRLARDGQVTGPGQPPPGHGRQVTGTLGQLLAGNCPGRDSETQTALVNPFGMAIEDLAVAAEIFAVAASLGLGQTLAR